MDLIEQTIHYLGFQAKAIADLVPNDSSTVNLLRESAETLHRAAGTRHGYAGERAAALHDDTYEAQRAQLDEAEVDLAKRGTPASLNTGVHREPGDAEAAQLRAMQDSELFDRWRGVTRELRRRKLIRSANRPLIGDYAETLVASAMNATRPSGRDRGVDLITTSGQRIQVKARRDPLGGHATHFDIANLEEERFDLLAGVHFAEDFGVESAWLVEATKLRELARPSGRKHRVRIADIRALELDSDSGVRPLEL